MDQIVVFQVAAAWMYVVGAGVTFLFLEQVLGSVHPWRATMTCLLWFVTVPYIVAVTTIKWAREGFPEDGD